MRPALLLVSAGVVAFSACGSASKSAPGPRTSVAETPAADVQTPEPAPPPLAEPGPAPALVVAPLPLPIDEPAGRPRLTSTAQGLTLSWLGGDTLTWSSFNGTWSPATTIPANPINSWADAPTVAATAHGWVALWLAPAAPDSHGTFVMAATSADGAAWTEASPIHDDASDTEHGFASVLTGADGVDVAWLDGRGYAMETNQTALLRRQLLPTRGPEVTVDERTCDCCPTGVSADGRTLAWRDRIGGEIRDVSMARGPDWTPTRATHDQWEYAGCPVNGPAVAAGLLAWHTGTEPPLVQASLLTEDAHSVTIDQGARVLGRVGVAWLGDRGVVTWARETEDGRAALLARTVARDGTLGAQVEIGTTASSRRAGFPTVAAHGDQVFVIWQDGDPARLQGVALSLRSSM